MGGLAYDTLIIPVSQTNWLIKGYIMTELIGSENCMRRIRKSWSFGNGVCTAKFSVVVDWGLF